jgi:head-tail adaptor
LTPTVSKGGETSYAYSTYKQRWAQWVQKSGTEIENDAEAIEGRIQHLWQVRKEGLSVTVDMRITYQGRTFKITNILGDPTDRRFVWISTTEIAEVQNG